MLERYSPTSYRIVGIDPGTDTLGIACLVVDLQARTIALEEAMTIEGHRNAKLDQSSLEVHGSRYTRLRAHYAVLRRTFERLGPHTVITESPFFKRRMANAFAALTECVAYIRFALYDYDARIALLTVDPPTAKKAVGVKGNSKIKEEVRDAIAASKILLNPLNIDIMALDEHSTDAIAVAMTRALEIMEHLK